MTPDKHFLRSKKGWGAILGSVTLIALAYLHADPYAFIAAGAIFAGHQAAQGAQDWRNGGKPL